MYLDNEKVYDRKEAGEGDFYPSLRALRAIKPKLEDKLKDLDELEKNYKGNTQKRQQGVEAERMKK